MPGLLYITWGLFAGCVGSGELQTRVSGRIVDEDENPLGPGVVLIERGPVHAGAYELGTPIDDEGRWAADLPSGGTWGIHLFVDDYQYVPLEITIADHQQVVIRNTMADWGTWMDFTGQTTWPTQPADDTLLRMPVDDTTVDNPILGDVTMAWEGDLLHVTADVTDPDGDLSRMVLAYDTVTGGGYALNPPSPPDSDGNYPNGTYDMLVYADPKHVPGESQWMFVVSDNMCNETQIRLVTLPER